MNQLIEKREQDKGFTLVELLIVIVILGILATVTVFAVQGITDKAEENTCANDKASLQTAVESYFTLNGSYPTAWSDVVTANILKEAPDSAKWNAPGAGGAITGTGTCTGA